MATSQYFPDDPEQKGNTSAEDDTEQKYDIDQKDSLLRYREDIEKFRPGPIYPVYTDVYSALPSTTPPGYPHVVDVTIRKYFAQSQIQLPDGVATTLFHLKREALDAFLDPTVGWFVFKHNGSNLKTVFMRVEREVIVCVQ